MGKGGQGTLYLARDLELGIYRAVKVLPMEQKREAALLRLLEYPYLPQMIDYVEQNEQCYLVMEYIRGKSLRQCLDEGRAFSVEEVIRIGWTVLEILMYLHSRKPAVYYGDLKPDNLMLTESGALYLVDFGSSVLGYERQMVTCFGTDGYAAPEQYQGKIGYASDLYALGRTLKELCGKKKIKCFFRYPYLAFFIWKCCRTQPEKRWKSAADAVAVFKNFKPFSLKIWRSFALGMCGFLVLLCMMGFYVGIQNKRPSFEAAISSVVSRYDSMGFRSGGWGVREIVLNQVEESAQRLLYCYVKREQQKRLLYLLAQNCELQGNIIKAETYYKQLVKEKAAGAEEYSTYGLFLIRQKRVKESMELYEKFQNRRGGEKTVQFERNLREWRKCLKKINGDNV